MMRIVLLFVCFIVGLAAGETWSATEYRLRLAELSVAVDAGDAGVMRQQAERIARAQIAWPSGLLPADPTLAPLARKQAVPALRQRLTALVTELAEVETVGAATAVDTAQLERLAAREADAGLRLQRGGSVAGNPYDPSRLPPSLGDRLSTTVGWVIERLWDVMEWLRKLFHYEKSGGAKGDGSGVVVITLIIVGALVLVGVVLAILAWPKRVLGPVVSAAQAAPLPIDADPRTRAADEWARYARELIALGRHREAIRAWYHAMLVNCWSHGLLHHRVGRTNWEYALTLPATVTWRGRFHDLTQRFDRAWYGGRVGADEAHSYAIEAEQLMTQQRTVVVGSRP
jgi:hypothetical protein